MIVDRNEQAEDGLLALLQVIFTCTCEVIVNQMATISCKDECQISVVPRLLACADYRL